MFNPTKLVIDSFVASLRENYTRMYRLWEPEYANIVAFVGRMALENIANSVRRTMTSPTPRLLQPSVRKSCAASSSRAAE